MNSFRVDSLLNSLITATFKDAPCLDIQKRSMLKSRVVKILDSSIPSGDVDIDLIIKKQLSMSPKFDSLAPLLGRLSTSRKVNSILYVVLSLQKNELPSALPAQKDRLLIEPNQSAKQPEARFVNYSLKEMTKDFARVIFTNSKNDLFYLSIGRENKAEIRRNIVIDPKVAITLGKTNRFLFFRQILEAFISGGSSSACIKIIQGLIRRELDFSAFESFSEKLSLMNLNFFLDQKLALFQTLALIVDGLSFCYSEDVAINFILKGFYLNSSLAIKQLFLEILQMINGFFTDKIMNFLLTPQIAEYFKVKPGIKDSVFAEIEIFEETLPFKILTKDLLTKIYKTKQITLFMSELTNTNTFTHTQMTVPDFRMYDENSILLLREEIESRYRESQIIILTHLFARENIFEHLEIYKDIILGGNSTFLSQLIEQLSKLDVQECSRMVLLQTLEGVFFSIPKRYQQYMYQFDILNFEPLEGEALSNNFFLFFQFSQLCSIIIDKRFQDNSMRFFNFSLKLKEFYLRMQKFFWERRKLLYGRFHALMFLVEKFYKDLMFYIYHYVIEDLYQKLIKRIPQVVSIEDLHALLRHFSQNIIDFCFLNHENFAQRKVFRMLELVNSRLSNFFEMIYISDSDCYNEIKAFRKIFKEIASCLADLESQKPGSSYARLRLMLEFNDYLKYN